MIYKISILPQFEVDLDEAYNWYFKTVNEITALRLIDEVLAYIELIEKNPYTSQVYKTGVRKINLKVFPYKILFKIKRSSIIVFALFHHKREY
jgi:plasmid stabilization system protein ParE